MASKDDTKSVKDRSCIEYDLIGIKDLDSVNELLVTQFFRNEPLGKKLGANSETDVRPWLSEVTQPIINQGVSTIITINYYMYRNTVISLQEEDLIFYIFLN